MFDNTILRFAAVTKLAATRERLIALPPVLLACLIVSVPSRSEGAAGHFEMLLPPTNGGLVEFTAVQDGDWNDPATWGQATNTPADAPAPADGELDVSIPAGLTVTVRGQYGGTAVETVRVAGVLDMDGSVNTRLLVDTIVVEDTGRFGIGTAASPVLADRTAEIIWTDDLIDSTADVEHLSKGLDVYVKGQLRFYGSTKKPFVPFDTANPAGANSITVKQNPEGWRVGDEIAIAATRFVRTQLQSENFRIKSLTDNGNGTWTIALGSLANFNTNASMVFAHTPYPGMDAHVANLTRNIIFRSGPLATKSAVQRRGHVMSMSQDVIVEGAEFRNMGRTDKKLGLDDVANGVAGTNQRARYSFHFHRNQLFDQGPAGAIPSRVTGCVANSGPGWGFVNHTSWAEFRDCVTWDMDGAGFVCEAGNEIGKFDGNIAIEGMGIPSRKFRERVFEGGKGVIATGNLGQTGDGFWLQSPGVEVTNNIASGFDGRGFAVWTQGLFEPDLDEEAAFNTALIDWQVGGYRIWNEPGKFHHGKAVTQELTFKRFEDNIAYGSYIGLQIRFHHNTNRSLARVNEPLEATGTYDRTRKTTFRRVTTWNNEWGFGGLSYVHGLILEDSKALTNQTEDGIRYAMNADHALDEPPIFRNLEVAGYRSIVQFSDAIEWTFENPNFSVRGNEPAFHGKGRDFFVPYVPLTDVDALAWPFIEDDTVVAAGSTVVPVLTNDSSPVGQALSVESFGQGMHGTVLNNGNGTLTYLPTTGFLGQDSFEYVARDASGRKDVASVQVTVSSSPGGGGGGGGETPPEIDFELDFTKTANVGDSGAPSYEFAVPVSDHPTVTSVNVRVTATSGEEAADIRNQTGKFGLTVLGGDANGQVDLNSEAESGAEALIFSIVPHNALGVVPGATLTLRAISVRHNVGDGYPGFEFTSGPNRLSSVWSADPEFTAVAISPNFTFGAGSPLTATRIGDPGLRTLRTMSFVMTFDGAAMLDDDGDGIANGFEKLNGLSSRDPDDAMGDPDGNGIAALLEYGLAFEIHGYEGIPKSLAHVEPSDGKTYPAIEYIRLQEATVNADLSCEISSILGTFVSGPMHTSVVSITDNEDGTETVIERSNTPIEDVERQFMRLAIQPK